MCVLQEELCEMFRDNQRKILSKYKTILINSRVILKE